MDSFRLAAANTVTGAVCAVARAGRASISTQNAVAASGVVQAGPERVSLRVSGQFTSEESLRDVNLRFNDRFFRLGSGFAGIYQAGNEADNLRFFGGRYGIVTEKSTWPSAA